MTIRNAALAALLTLTLASHARADARIETRDGTIITGDIVSMDNDTYVIRTPYGTQTIPAASIVSIRNNSQGTGNGLPQRTVFTGGPLRLAGSTTIGDELAPALLEAYAAAKGAEDISWKQDSQTELDLTARGNGKSFAAHVSRHGSGTAFTALSKSAADIGMASRRVQPAEVSSLAAQGLGIFTQPGQENVLALDGLLVVVNKENSIDSLSVAQIRDVFSGRITDWSQVGGQSGPIHLYGRDSDSGTADTFNALVMAPAKVASTISLAKGAEEIAVKVLGDPAGIGYTGFAYLGDTKALSIRTDCGLTFPPIDLLVRTEEYPLSRRLYLYAPNQMPNVEAQPFIDFALGPKGQDLAREKGFIDLKPRAATVSFSRSTVAIGFIDAVGDNGYDRGDLAGFTDYARHIINGARVSTTFRFQTGSSELDTRAVKDIERLADYLKSPSIANHTVLIAGFSDSAGASDRNRMLSRSRAAAVAALLQGRGVAQLQVAGYGKAAPVACNTTPEGQEKNRRVEAWLVP